MYIYIMKEQENKTEELNSLANQEEKKERAKTVTLTMEQIEELAKDEKLRKCFAKALEKSINVAGNIVFQTAKMLIELI